MSRSLWVSGVVLLMAASVYGQGPPTMKVKGGVAVQNEFVLSSLKVSVRIHGPLAETTMIMTFFNPHDRELEGELDFPLPEGATVSGYGLDVGDTIVDGVVVDKQKARRVFEEIARQPEVKDPGLVEKVRGNSFKTRVFPMWAKGSRIIKVSYVSQLNTDGRDPIYRLPLTYNKPVKAFELRLEVVSPVIEPICEDTELTDFEFEKGANGYLAEVTKTDVTLSKDLLITVPQQNGEAFLVEKAPDGQLYYLIHDQRVPREAHTEAEPPRNVVLVWDTSASNGGRDHERELTLLRNYFLMQSRTVRVTLMDFNVTLRQVDVFDAGPTGCERLIQAIEKLRYDGGTRMSALAALSKMPKPDFFMLFSDGLNTFGAESAVTFPRPLYAFCNTKVADYQVLKRLTGDSGGRFFNLRTMDDRAIVPFIGKSAMQFRGVTSSATKCGEHYPSRAMPVAAEFVLVGKLSETKETLTVRYGPDTKTARERIFTVRAQDAVDGTLLRRFWAQSKIDEIAFIKGKKGADEITAIGKEFGIVTAGTSLMVLERLEQYVQYDIMPPDSLPKMKNAFLAQKREPSRGETRLIDNPEALHAQWKAKVEWWKTIREYKKIASFQKTKPANGSRRTGATGTAAIASNTAENWLTRSQREDGSWGTDAKHRPTLTALALLGFLSRGETPLSEQYGRTVQKAMRWLGDDARRDRDGFFVSDEAKLGHAVATWALAESYAMTKIPFIHNSLKKALIPMISHQKANGAFALNYKKDGTNHLWFTGANVLALRASRMAGMSTPGMDDAITRCKSALKKEFLKPAGFSLDGTLAPDPLSTAIGARSMQVLGMRGSEEYLKAMTALEKPGFVFDLNTGEDWPIIRHYCLNAILFDGQRDNRKGWRAWRPVMERTLRDSQEEDGTWDIPASSKATKILKPDDAKHYASCALGLFLEVYYRYLPTSDRQNAGDVDAVGAAGDGLVIEIGGDAPQDIQDGSTPIVVAPIKLKLAAVENSETYMKELESSPGNLYATYLDLRPKYSTAPAFYSDCADLLLRKGLKEEGIRVLSNIVELKLDDPVYLRIVARKLEEIGEIDLAIETYEQVKDLRSDELQSFRDLALALEARSLKSGTPAGPDAARAIELMKHVIDANWSRFQEVKPIVLVELNRLVARAKKAGLKDVTLDPKFLTPMTPDLRIVLSWDQNDTDMDLWVLEPTDEKCYYSFRYTRLGGRMSPDITAGYGPEEYMIRKAVPGKYQVKVNYFGNNSARLTGLVNLKIDIFRHYGTDKEEKQTITRRLKGAKHVIDVCDFTIEGEPLDVVVPTKKGIGKELPHEQ